MLTSLGKGMSLDILLATESDILKGSTQVQWRLRLEGAFVEKLKPA